MNVFKQVKKSGCIPIDDMFDSSVLDVSDISEDDIYYCALLLFPSIAEQRMKLGLKTACADATHCQVVGPKGIVPCWKSLFLTARNILLLSFAHLFGGESLDTCIQVFQHRNIIPSFHVCDRTTIEDQEKCIGTTYSSFMDSASLFWTNTM